MSVTINIQSLIEKIEIKVIPDSEDKEEQFCYNKTELVTSIQATVLSAFKQAVEESNLVTKEDLELAKKDVSDSLIKAIRLS